MKSRESCQWWAACLFWSVAGATSVANAGQVVVDIAEAGQPLEHAVVFLLPADGSLPPPANPTGIMDQQQAEFVPHVLVVRRGARVRFPNSDNIRHHVYSFSLAKIFELRLYSGTPAEPIIFNTVGPVVLGCNIHDWMLGFIYVVDTPWYAKSGVDGRVELNAIPAGDYVMQIWHPRLPDINQPVSQSITVLEEGAVKTKINLTLTPPVVRAHDNVLDTRRGNLREQRRAGG